MAALGSLDVDALSAEIADATLGALVKDRDDLVRVRGEALAGAVQCARAAAAG